jgi:hypothetical protein
MPSLIGCGSFAADHLERVSVEWVQQNIEVSCLHRLMTMQVKLDVVEWNLVNAW